MDQTMAERLTEALRDAAEAHHTYEVELGGPDADWQPWYAQHMTRTLNDAGYRLCRTDPS